MIMNVTNFEPVDEGSANVRRYFVLKKLAIVSITVASCGTAATLYSNQKSAVTSAHQQANLQGTSSLTQELSFESNRIADIFGSNGDDDSCIPDGTCVRYDPKGGASKWKDAAAVCCSKETHLQGCDYPGTMCGTINCDSTATSPRELCAYGTHGSGDQIQCPTECIDDAKKVCPCPIIDEYKICAPKDVPGACDPKAVGPRWGPLRCCANLFCEALTGTCRSENKNVIEAKKVLTEVINQINNVDNNPSNRGVLQHGFFNTNSDDLIKMYTNPKEGKIDWDKPENYEITTDGHGIGWGTSNAVRPYGSSWGIFQHGLKPVVFNAYGFNAPLPGFLLKFDKNSHIDKANTVMSVFDGDTNERNKQYVSRSDPILLHDMQSQDPSYKGNYKCEIDCYKDKKDNAGICTATAPKGSISNSENWEWHPVSIQPFVTEKGEPKAYVGSTGAGWNKMFGYDNSGNSLDTDRTCLFLREDKLDSKLVDSQKVYTAWRNAIVQFQKSLSEFICRSRDNCRYIGDYLEPEVSIYMTKLTEPGMKEGSRSPIAFGDEFMAVTINTRTCEEFHQEDSDAVCAGDWLGSGRPEWMPKGKPFKGAVEAEKINEVTAAGCYMSLQLSQEFGRFIPVFDAKVLSNILTYGNIKQWSNPKWDDASNYITVVDCCAISNLPKNTVMKQMYADSNLDEFKC